eukprot:2830658-Rhodomonas_salina.1
MVKRNIARPCRPRARDKGSQIDVGVAARWVGARRWDDRVGVKWQELRGGMDGEEERRRPPEGSREAWGRGSESERRLDRARGLWGGVDEERGSEGVRN